MTAPRTATRGSVVDRLRRTLLDVLARHVPRSDAVALIDFPIHFNVGDAAIWLGELVALREGGWEIAYAGSHQDYDPDRVRERIGSGGTVLLHGGGNLGDLYPRHQELRLRVLSDLQDLRVVQLPQTVRFLSDEALEATTGPFAAHPDFTLLARDRESVRIGIERLGCRTDLCPDSAFALGPLERSNPAVSEVLLLARRDFESGLANLPAALPGVLVDDWPLREPLARRLLRAGALRAGRAANRHPAIFPAAAPLAWRGYELVTRGLVRSGAALLSRGETVVTDRLHGHILCLLMGIPHVLIPDRFGKVAAFNSTWSTDTPLIDATDRPGEAIRCARRLVTAGGG